jgi:WD40 repeat protein
MDREQALNEIITAYLKAVEAGQAADPAEWLARYPEFAGELMEFFADQKVLDRAAAPLRAVLSAPSAAGEALTVAPGDGQVRQSLGSIRYFGDYELLEEIARGGMGVVYRARQVSLSRVVALKMILAGHLASPEDVQRFHREAEAAANLDHPHIVPIYEVGEHQGQHYFSMKLIEGGSLAQWIAVCRSQITDVRKEDQRAMAQLLATAAHAVHHAHQRGILHRDLKPGNILLQADQSPSHNVSGLQSVIPFVTDFGLAKQVEGSGHVTRSGGIIGTPSYMPPEQARSEKVLTTAVDVYSLGAVLYELLAGRPPFRAETPLDTVLQVLDREPERPSKLNPGIDRDLETICLKCLQKDPAQRYGSAEKLAEDLERWLAGEPIQARASTAWERGIKWVRRRPAAAALVLISVLTVAALVAGGLWIQQERQAQALLAVKHQAEMDSQAQLSQERQLRSLLEEARAERLSGNRQRALEVLADAAHIERSELVQQEAIQIAASPGVRLLRTIPVGHVNTVKFSADGQLLAIHGCYGIGQGWRTGDPDPASTEWLKVFRLPTGELLASTRLRAGHGGLGVGMSGWQPEDFTGYNPFLFSPQAPILALADSTTEALRLWNPTSGNDSQTLKLCPSGVVFSPDGTLLTGTEKIEQGEIVMWNLRKRAIQTRLKGGMPAAFLSQDELVFRFWDAKHGGLRRVRIADGMEQFVTPKGTEVLALSGDGRVAALCASQAPKGAPVTIWDLTAGRQIGTVASAAPAYQNPYGLRFSHNGGRLALDDPLLSNIFKIWIRETGQVQEGINGAIYGEGDWNHYQRAAFSPNGALLAAYAQKNKSLLQLWDVASSRRICTLRDSHTPVWRGDGRLLATLAPGQIIRDDGSGYGGPRAYVNIWEVAEPLPVYNLHQPVETAAFGQDDTHLVAGDQVIKVATAPGQPVLRSTPHAAREVQVALVRAGQPWGLVCPTLAATDRPSKLVPLVGPGAEIALMKPVPKGSPLGLRNPEPLVIPLLSGCAFDPSGRYLAAICHIHWKTQGGFQSMDSERILALWDLTNPAPPIVTEDRSEREALAISADGKQIALGGGNGVEIRELPSLRALYHFRFPVQSTVPLTGWKSKTSSGSGPEEYVFKLHSVRFSPDGHKIYAASADGRINVADLESPRELTPLQGGHKGAVLCLAIDASGQWLASGGQDRTIRLWNTATNQEVARWEAHEEAVTALDFAYSGEKLVSGGSDGYVKLWDLARIRRELAQLGLDW